MSCSIVHRKIWSEYPPGDGAVVEQEELAAIGEARCGKIGDHVEGHAQIKRSAETGARPRKKVLARPVGLGRNTRRKQRLSALGASERDGSLFRERREEFDLVGSESVLLLESDRHHAESLPIHGERNSGKR